MKQGLYSESEIAHVLEMQSHDLEILPTKYHHGVSGKSPSGGHVILLAIGEIDKDGGNVIGTALTRKQAKKLRDWLIKEIPLKKACKQP